MCEVGIFFLHAFLAWYQMTPKDGTAMSQPVKKAQTVVWWWIKAHSVFIVLQFSYVETGIKTVCVLTL